MNMKKYYTYIASLVFLFIAVFGDQRFAGSYLLVFDDLYRSGGTLNAICNTLIKQGSVKRVYTLTITMTRKKQ